MKKPVGDYLILDQETNTWKEDPEQVVRDDVEKHYWKHVWLTILKDWRLYLMLVPMLLLLGAVTSVGFTHLTVLIKGQGFSAHTAALGVTVIGVALTVGKLFYGALSEKLSTFHSNWLFGGLIALGLLLICFVLPAVLCPLLNAVCRRLGWVKDGDLTLS